mgnify:CR=1 FL=1
MNSVSTSILKILFIASVITFTFAATKATLRNVAWTQCYSSKQQVLYFQNKKTKDCKSDLFFKAPATHHLFETPHTGAMFSEASPGTAQVIKLKNGRRILISQWSKHARSNEILVLEPNFASNKIKQHCNIENYNDPFEVKYNSISNQLYIKVSEPIKPLSKKHRKRWKRCKI